MNKSKPKVAIGQPRQKAVAATVLQKLANL